MSGAERAGLASLSVTSTLLPLSAIEAHFGLPGEGACWSIGEPRRGAEGWFYAHSRWSLQSGQPEGAPLDRHLAALFLRMERVRDALGALPPTLNAWIACTARFPDRETPFALAAGHFETAAGFGLSLDFDFCFDGPQDEDDPQVGSAAPP